MQTYETGQNVHLLKSLSDDNFTKTKPTQATDKL